MREREKEKKRKERKVGGNVNCRVKRSKGRKKDRKEEWVQGKVR